MYLNLFFREQPIKLINVSTTTILVITKRAKAKQLIIELFELVNLILEIANIVAI